MADTGTTSVGAHALAAIGTACSEVVKKRLLAADVAPTLWSKEDDLAHAELADAFRGTWSDEKAAQVLDLYLEKRRTTHVDLPLLARWVQAHPNEPQSVIDCLTTIPPDELSLHKVLSRKGSQKLVFLASWRRHQRPVVAKRILGPQDHVKKLLGREAQTHPLNIEHQNIVPSYVFYNSLDEPFLVEELVDALSDETQLNPLEASNLFFDIASALQYLHARDYVHGDVKPDNLGFHLGRYRLLDFGIARARSEFTPEVTATGSLRTRAPELLANDKYNGDARKADVWALGATIFNTLVRRFPLLDMDEAPPRITDPIERHRFEQKLQGRVHKEWNDRIKLTGLPERLKKPLEGSLRLDPAQRYTAEELLTVLTQECGLYLRHATSGQTFSPQEELGQIMRVLRGRVLSSTPVRFQQALRGRLEALKQMPGIEVRDIDGLLAQLHT